MSPCPPAKNVNSSQVDVVTSRTLYSSSYSGMIPWSFIQSITGSGENANRTMLRSPSPPSPPPPPSSPHAAAVSASAHVTATSRTRLLVRIRPSLVLTPSGGRTAGGRGGVSLGEAGSPVLPTFQRTIYNGQSTDRLCPQSRQALPLVPQI